MLSLYKTQTFLDSTCFSVLYEYDSPYPPCSFSPSCSTFQPMLATGQEQFQAPAQNTTEEMECMPSPTPVQAAGSAATAHCPNPNPPRSPKPDAFEFHLSCQAKTNHMSDSSIPTARLNIAALRKELARNTLNTNSNFLEHLLPRERLPFPVNE